MKSILLVAVAFGFVGTAKADLKNWGPEELLAAHKIALPVIEQELGGANFRAIQTIKIVKSKKNNAALVTVESQGNTFSVNCHVHDGKAIDCH